MFHFAKQMPEKRIFSKIWPTAEAPTVFNSNAAYPINALNASLATAGFALASVLLMLSKKPSTKDLLLKVENMIFETLEKDAQYYEVRGVLLLEHERQIWHQETNSSSEARSRIHTIFLTVFSPRVFVYQKDCHRDLSDMQKFPGHMGLEFFTKRVLSHILGLPVLDDSSPMESGLDDALSLAYFNALMTELLKET